MKDKQLDIFQNLIKGSQPSKADRPVIKGEDSARRKPTYSSVRVKQDIGRNFPTKSFDERDRQPRHQELELLFKNSPKSGRKVNIQIQKPTFKVDPAKKEELASIRARYSFLESQDD